VKRVWRALLVPMLSLAVAAASAAEAKRPDFSGFWMPMRQQVEPDPVLAPLVPKDAVVMRDTGAAEFGLMQFGGLKLKPAALAAARNWDPKQDMTVANACRIPSIVYALQGPFPIEIFQGTELMVMRMEYFDMARVMFLDGRVPPPANAPHTKTGYTVAHWEGEVLVAVTTHLKSATITNNGLEHSDAMRVTERYRLADGGRSLIVSQEYEDPEVLENRGVRYIGWRRMEGDHVRAYDCDPSFAEDYAKP
jgi:hypothetical protein